MFRFAPAPLHAFQFGGGRFAVHISERIYGTPVTQSSASGRLHGTSDSRRRRSEGWDAVFLHARRQFRVRRSLHPRRLCYLCVTQKQRQR